MISVLATVDGSAESLAVIAILEKLATEFKAHVHLLTVAERPKAAARRSSSGRSPFRGAPGVPGGVTAPNLAVANEPLWAESEDQAFGRALAEGRDFLEFVARPLRERGFEVEVNAVVDRNVSRAIIEYARGRDFDLIAMATHGRGGLSDLVQGSVASAVVRASVAPVLLVRPTKAQVRSYRAALSSARRGGVLRLVSA